MSEQRVVGFTTADIMFAAANAGPGGRVIVDQPGQYDIDALTVLEPDQTWLIDNRRAVLKRTATSAAALALDVKAPGFRIRGGTIDANRTNTVAPGWIIGAFNFDLDAEDIVLKGAAAWGVAVSDASLRMERVKVLDTKNASVIYTTGTGSGREGPQINACLFDRSGEDPNTMASGGVLIQDTRHTSEFVLYPRFTNNRILMPATYAHDSVGLEMLFSQRAIIANNIIIGGRIGVTWAGGLGHVYGNTFQLQSSYAIELGSHDSIIENNSGTGYYMPVKPENAGITVNPVVRDDIIVCNRFPGFAAPILIGSGATLKANWANV